MKASFLMTFISAFGTLGVEIWGSGGFYKGRFFCCMLLLFYRLQGALRASDSGQRKGKCYILGCCAFRRRINDEWGSSYPLTKSMFFSLAPYTRQNDAVVR